MLSMCFLTAVVLAPLAFGQRKLSSEEREVAQSVFGESIIYDAVRLRQGSVLTRVYPAFTLGNVITFPRNEYDLNDVRDRALLVHELCHVWQFQNGGWGYMPRAIYEEVTQPDAYTVYYDQQKKLRDYDIEEQCEIAAEYFLGDDRYASYIQEFQGR